MDEEIRATFDCDNNASVQSENEELRVLLRKHKRLIIKSLNKKWDILSLESYINNKSIPRGLRERVVPTTHLQTEIF